MSEQVSFDPIRHEYRNAAGVAKPSVTWILAQSGLCDFSFVDDEVRERAMTRGKSVHWMLQLEDEGALEYRKVPRRLRPYRKAYLNWKRCSGFTPHSVERSFISPFGYAGTFDRFGSLPETELFPFGSNALIDLKTGGIQDWVRFQLAAYVRGLYWRLPAHLCIVRRIALALMADGSHRVIEFPRETLEHDFSVFMEALRRTGCQLKQ
jgi:hypothetical protein